MKITKLNEEMNTLLNESDVHKLDLSFEGESGWVNHVNLELDNDLYEDIKKYNIEFMIDETTIDEIDGDEHLIDEITDEIREYVDNTLVLNAYCGDKYYSTLLYDGGDNDLLYGCIEALVDKIKSEKLSESCMYKVNESDREVKKIQFVTIDDWNRPIFKMKHNGRFYYLSDINNLFDYGTTVQRIKQFYKDKKPLRDYITFHGHRIDDDPMGTTMRFDLEIE